jgi:effector-binding domain-containing protein
MNRIPFVRRRCNATRGRSVSRKYLKREKESSDGKTKLSPLTGRERPYQGAERYCTSNRGSKMPRVSKIDVFRKREQPTLSIRTRTKVEDLPVLIGESYCKMTAYLKELSEYLSDVPYVAYHNMDMQNLDVEIGFPVPAALPAKEDIQSGSIPASKVVFCIYRGAYRDMASTYGEMATWIEENGLKPVGTAYEHYYNGPEYPESELLTMIVMPVV